MTKMSDASKYALIKQVQSGTLPIMDKPVGKPTMFTYPLPVDTLESTEQELIELIIRKLK